MTAEVQEFFVVRLWDGMDGGWINVSGEVTQDEAERIWNEKTENGTVRTKYEDIDDYRIFPARMTMLWSEGREMFRG